MKLRHFLSLQLLAITFFVLAGNAHAQSAPNINVKTAVASNKVQRGRTVIATVVMEIPSGYHVNSNRPLEKFLVATLLSVDNAADLRTGPVIYPRAILRALKFSKNRVAVFEGRAIMRFNITVPANANRGSKEVKLRLRYQACSDDVCFPPQTKYESVWIDVQ